MSVGANRVIFAVAISAFASGCASQDIPQAYRGRLFERVSPLGPAQGPTGFVGPVLGPGSYSPAAYGEIHKVECAVTTVREHLSPLTKDGVSFRLNVYVRFSPDCSDEGVQTILSVLPVDENNSVTADKVYQTYVQPAISEAVREVIAPVKAAELNERRAEVIANIRRRFLEMVAQRDRHIAVVHEVDLSDFTFPSDIQKANNERALQAVLRDKAVNERDRVAAEIEAAEMRLEQKTGARAAPAVAAPATPPATPPAAAPPAPAQPAPAPVAGAADAVDDNPYKESTPPNQPNM
jgi:hypothetical protein